MTKRILITGANRGIGLETVRQYAQLDWQVVATCRSPENAIDLNQLQLKFSDQINVLPLDVTNQQHIDATAAAIGDQPIDILFNNAGVYGQSNDHFGHLKTDTWQKTFLVNTIAPLKIMEALIEAIAASQLKTIVTLTSKMGSICDNSSGGCYTYRTSKAALNAALKSAAIDLIEQGIKVLIIHPGWVKTDMGGLNAEITTEKSVAGIRHVIERTALKDSGSFYEYDGTLVSW